MQDIAGVSMTCEKKNATFVDSEKAYLAVLASLPFIRTNIMLVWKVWSFCSILVFVSYAVSSERRQLYQADKCYISRASSSSAQSSIVDDILSRPPLALPNIYTTDGQGSREAGQSLPSLSRKEVSAVYRDYVQDATSRRYSQQDPQIQENDEEYEYEDEIYGDKEDIYSLEAQSEDADDEEFSNLRSSKSCRPLTTQEESNKKLFERAWRTRGLDCNVNPRDLAMGVVQIKVDLYEYDIAPSIGIFASRHVRKEKGTEVLE